MHDNISNDIVHIQCYCNMVGIGKLVKPSGCGPEHCGFESRYLPIFGTLLSNYFSKCWIFNKMLKQSRSIKKELLDEYLLKGWKKGRKIKFDF